MHCIDSCQPHLPMTERNIGQDTTLSKLELPVWRPNMPLIGCSLLEEMLGSQPQILSL